MSHRLDPGLHAPGLHGHFGLVTGPGAPTTVLAGVMTPTIPLFDSVWFQALVVFVAINTLIYAGLAVAKLIPRRRLERAGAPTSHPDRTGSLPATFGTTIGPACPLPSCSGHPAAEPISDLVAASSSRRPSK